MTIATPKTSATNQAPARTLYQPFLAGVLLLCPIASLALRRRKHIAATKLILFAVASAILSLATGCGDRIKTDPLLTTPPKPTPSRSPAQPQAQPELPCNTPQP
jgi:hypothetical protein